MIVLGNAQIICGGNCVVIIQCRFDLENLGLRGSVIASWLSLSTVHTSNI